MCVSERFDSNVFYKPSSPGLNREDFVTSVNPVLRVNHEGAYASGYLNVGGFSETYVKNPGLNYFGTSDTLFLNLDNSIKRWLPNASLSIFDSFRYTPLPPGFVNPAAGTSPSDPANSQNVYAQGFLASRTNNVINNASVSTSYATTASTSLYASYSYAILRFLGSSSSSTQGQSLSNSTTQSGTVGGSAQLSGLDTLNIRFAHMQSEIISISGTTSRVFTSDTATIAWSRILTPNLRGELGGGGILIGSGDTSYAANAALIMNSLNNSATISYARSALPSFLGTGGIMIGDVFSLSAVQRIDRQWQLSESASYAHTTGTSGINSVEYNSFFLGGTIEYWVTSIWSATLGYNYSKFNNSSGSAKTDFDRQVIALSIRATWE